MGPSRTSARTSIHAPPAKTGVLNRDCSIAMPMTDMPLSRAIAGRRSRRDFVPDRPIDRNVLERVLESLQGRTDDRDNRAAPSAHGLHPLRLLVTVARVDDLEPGLYSVDTDARTLERVHGRDLRAALRNAAVDDQSWMTDAACIVSICADLVTPSRDFADQRPFGTRGLRYVYIEAGAAAQNASLQAVAEDIGCVLVGGFDDEATASILNLQPPIAPVLHLCFGHVDGDTVA